MLTELNIENFAIIQNLKLDLGSGLITFTGETGAGKSIILDAVEALVGGRVDATAIRSGADRSLVEATFQIPPDNRVSVHAILEREDLLDDPDYVIMGRELRREGRNTARVNGRSVSVSLLRELGEFLVDIHGQSEHLSLLNVRQHLNLLDRYANNAGLLDAYTKMYRTLTALRRELAALRQDELDATRRMDLLNFQADEIEAAHLQVDEEDELRRERDRLANAENLAAYARQIMSLLEEGTIEAPSISDLLSQIITAISSISRIDPSQTRLADQVEAMSSALDDLGREMSDYLDGLEFNPRRLIQVEERLDVIHNLKRKYGGSIDAVLAFGRDARASLDKIAHAGERIEELENQEQTLLKELASQALSLSEARKKAAVSLSNGVEKELSDLSMLGARFMVDFKQVESPDGLPFGEGQRLSFDDRGFDRVEFLIAPNPGEGFKPLVKIASGGETSRLMLALKNVLAQADYVPTLIFDEIDQGIGGRVGAIVGEKLWQLARRHQVLCVTHLPQLAAYGRQHFRVQKGLDSGRTQTEVQLLDDDKRVEEMAQMFGPISEENRAAARATLDQARSRTQVLASAIES